jgi:hypothetical protein
MQPLTRPSAWTLLRCPLPASGERAHRRGPRSRPQAAQTLGFTDLRALAPAGSLYLHPFRVRLDTALCFFKRSKPAKYEIIPLGVKERGTLDDLELRVAILQVPNRWTARIPLVGGHVKPSIFQSSLRLCLRAALMSARPHQRLTQDADGYGNRCGEGHDAEGQAADEHPIRAGLAIVHERAFLVSRRERSSVSQSPMPRSSRCR